MISYPALFEPDTQEGGFVVTFPDLNHGATQGETEQEAMEMAEDFLLCVVGDYLKGDKALCRLPGRKSRKEVSLGSVVRRLQACGSVELYQAFRASGLRKSELARRFGNVEREY